MGRPARQLWALLLGAACALAAANAIAAAAPAHRTLQRRWCVRHPQARPAARRTHRCRPSKRSSAQSRSSLSGASGSPSAGGTASTPPPSAGSPSAAGSPPNARQPVEAAPPPPSVPRVQITAVEYSFTLSRTSVPAGKVILEFVNQGQDEHNLNVAPSEGPVAGAFANTPSKGISDQRVILRAGAYTLFCSLPEHRQKGMKATLLVE